jgi:hypothetical protein
MRRVPLFHSLAHLRRLVSMTPEAIQSAKEWWAFSKANDESEKREIAEARAAFLAAWKAGGNFGRPSELVMSEAMSPVYTAAAARRVARIAARLEACPQRMASLAAAEARGKIRDQERAAFDARWASRRALVASWMPACGKWAGRTSSGSRRFDSWSLVLWLWLLLPIAWFGYRFFTSTPAEWSKVCERMEQQEMMMERQSVHGDR